MLYDEASESSIFPRLTGIPPHVTMLNNFHTLHGTIKTSASSLYDRIKEDLDNRGLGGDAFQANGVLEDVKRIHQRIEEVLTLNPRESTVDATHAQAPLFLVDERGNRRRMYCWGGKLHNLPENFTLPFMTLQTLICNWYCGSTNPHCPPLKYAKCFDFPKPKTMKVVLSQMNRLMKVVTRAGEKVEFHFGLEGINTTAKATKLYESIHHLFRINNCRSCRRFSSISWKTVHNSLVKNKMKLAGET